MTSSTVLFELGTEELPAGEYEAMARSLGSAMLSGLQHYGLSAGDARVLATPRRLAVVIQNVADRAANRHEEVLGPPVTAARTADGEWTPAAIRIAKNQGLSPQNQKTNTTERHE